MLLRALAAFCCAPTLAAQTTGFSVVSAASYQGTIASDSIAAIFGSNLARITASATLDANGQLPTELANARVQVNGQVVSLIFASPGQINFVVPSGIAAGTATVVISRTDLGTSRNGTALMAASAPAIFSSDASGSGPGAILNAVTFAGPPFLTVTPQNGADPRTRLAVYGTGIRNAKTVTATATDSSANRYNLTVEFAGAAPGFSGLDQVNVIVPADLDGAGAVSLSISTEDATSNIVTFQMGLLPVSSLLLAGIAISPAAVTAGNNMTAAISLNGVARTGGFPVSLHSSNLAATVPSFVVVPTGKASVTTTVQTSVVSGVQTGTITATAGTVTVSAGFELDPPNQAQLSAITVNPASALGGRTVQGTVTLASPAPAGGVSVQLSSDNTSAVVPASVMVPFNQNSANFSITTSAVTAAQTANLTATLYRTTVSTRLSLLPLLALSFDSASVVGGATVTGTITLAEPAPGGATISLTSSNNSVAPVPAVITISSGQTTGTFSILTTAVSATQTITISAKYMSTTQTAQLTVNPQPVAALSSLSIYPSTVNGGTAVQGTVTLTAPAGPAGFTVSVQSSLPSAAVVPTNFVMVPAGQSSATFQITTFRVVTQQTVTFTAKAGTVTVTATLTVQ